MLRKNMTFGKRIGLGFGIVLFLLAGVSVLSYFGIADIVDNAGQVIRGNKLNSILAQREIDHLNWAKQMTEFLTNDDVSTLEIETDHRKCAFGKWLYGEQRLAAEKNVPSLAALFKKIEAPHQRLHESAIAIG